MDYSDILQDISVDLSFMIKKHLKNIKKLDSKKQKAFGKLFVDMKQGVDDLSEGVNESVNEANYNTKQDAMNAYMNGKVSAKELDKIAKNDFKSSVATKKELQNFLDSGYMKTLMANTYGLKVPAMEKKVKELMRFAEGTLKEDIQYFESLDEGKSMDMKKRLKVYDKLKKGDKITIKYGSSMRGGVEKEFVVSKGKTLVGKQKVERIILKNPANPSGVKYYLYNRDGNVSLAKGDMAAVIVNMIPESVNEGLSVTDERHFGKKGIIIMIDDNGKKVSAIFKDKKNANKFNRNKPADIKKLLQLAKKTKYPKAIDESVNEEKYVVYVDKDGKGRSGRKIVKSDLTYNSAKRLSNKLAKTDDYQEVGFDDHKSWNQNNIEKLNERMDKRQAAETLKQLGGNKFIMMTGAKNFGFGSNGLSFKIGRNAKAVNYVVIDLNGKDLYDMKFQKGTRVLKKANDVYGDQLQKIFTKYTGMYTSL